MANNNLRILYNNILDINSSISATNTNVGYPISNILKDTKGMVWRTNTGTTSSTLTVTWSSVQSISTVISPYTNLTASATWRIKLYSDITLTTLLYDSGAVIAVPAVLQNLYTNTLGGNYRYAYGGSSCARKYFTQVNNVRAMVIDIVDTANTDTYLEISRILLGSYWSPTYNTEFGISLGISDSSTKYRTQSGNLITDNGTSNKTLNFNLSYMTSSDRNILFNILSTLGFKKSLYVSIFPEDADPVKEQMYQIYGRLSDMATINHPMYTVYSSSISLEEV